MRRKTKMTDNLREFIKEVDKNEAIREKCDNIINEIREAAQKGQEVTPDILEPILKIAGELGLQLEAADLTSQKKELTEEDMQSVAGGAYANPTCDESGVADYQFPHWYYCQGFLNPCEFYRRTGANKHECLQKKWTVIIHT